MGTTLGTLLIFLEHGGILDTIDTLFHAKEDFDYSKAFMIDHNDTLNVNAKGSYGIFESSQVQGVFTIFDWLALVAEAISSREISQDRVIPIGTAFTTPLDQVTDPSSVAATQVDNGNVSAYHGYKITLDLKLIKG